MIVVDTNVLTYLVVAGEKTAVAQQAYQKDNNWVAPALWQHELLNVLSTHVKLGILHLPDALIAWQNCQQILVDRAFDVDMETALQLSTKEEISAYDAQFILLAQTFGCQLLTEDRQLVKKFPGLAFTLNEFLLT